MQTKIEKVRVLRTWDNYQKRPLQRKWIVFYKSGRVRKYTDFLKLPWTVFLYVTHPDREIVKTSIWFDREKQTVRLEDVKVRDF